MRAYERAYRHAAKAVLKHAAHQATDYSALDELAIDAAPHTNRIG